MWISKDRLSEIIQDEIEVYMSQHTFVNEVRSEIERAYKDDRAYTVDKADEIYSKTKREIKEYITSTEMLLQVVEVINKMQIPETKMSEEERDMLT